MYNGKIKNILSIFLCFITIIFSISCVPVYAKQDMTSVSIPVRCKIDKSSERFSFRLRAVGDYQVDCQKIEQSIISLHNRETKNFNIEYYCPGTYQYKIQQIPGYNSDIEYDDKTYNAFVYVLVDEYGRMHAEAVTFEDGEDSKTNGVVFRNRLKESGEDGDNQGDGQGGNKPDGDGNQGGSGNKPGQGDSDINKPNKPDGNKPGGGTQGGTDENKPGGNKPDGEHGGDIVIPDGNRPDGDGNQGGSENKPGQGDSDINKPNKPDGNKPGGENKPDGNKPGSGSGNNNDGNQGGDGNITIPGDKPGSGSGNDSDGSDSNSENENGSGSGSGNGSGSDNNSGSGNDSGNLDNNGQGGNNNSGNGSGDGSGTDTGNGTGNGNDSNNGSGSNGNFFENLYNELFGNGSSSNNSSNGSDLDINGNGAAIEDDSAVEHSLPSDDVDTGDNQIEDISKLCMIFVTSIIIAFLLYRKIRRERN